MCSFWARRSLAEVLAMFLGPGKVSGSCLRVVGQRSSLATGGLAMWLETGRSEFSAHWMPFVCILGFPLVYALINVGGRMYNPRATL